jgi:hypothetical protein
MKRPRRRRKPEHSWDRLNGTRLEVLPLPGGIARRVCVNATDPLAAVVSFGVHALTQPVDGPVVRLVAVDNWNNDPRELWQIPEARAWFRRLWHEGKPLLRLLSESTGDMPADDRLGLTERDMSQLGFGWADVFVVCMCTVDAAALNPDAGPGEQVWQLAAVAPDGNATRESIRAELLQMSPDNPEGYTFDDAANRRVFMENNLPNAEVAAHKAGHADGAVLVLSLLDPLAARVADEFGDADQIRATLVDCRRKDLHPGAVLALPRAVAAEVLKPFAPDAAGRVEAAPPKPGWQWAAFVAFNGTTLAAFQTTGGEG